MDARGASESAAFDSGRAAAARAAKTPELDPYLRDLDLTTRALAAGITLEELPDTPVIDIDLRYRAKELEVFLHTQALLELKLTDISARSLGEAEEKELSAEEQANHARWEAVGEEIKQDIRKNLFYQLAPDHLRAMMDLQKETETLKPLQGVSPGVARSVVALLQARTFTYGSWAKSRFREQLSEGDARKRLEARANE